MIHTFMIPLINGINVGDMNFHNGLWFAWDALAKQFNAMICEFFYRSSGFLTTNGRRCVILSVAADLQRANYYKYPSCKIENKKKSNNEDKCKIQAMPLCCLHFTTYLPSALSQGFDLSKYSCCELTDLLYFKVPNPV